MRSRSLYVEEFVAEGDGYYAGVTDAGVRISDICVRAEIPPWNSPHVPVLVSIWRTEDMELDSMVLTFSAYPNSIFL